MVIKNNIVERPTRTTLTTFYGTYITTGCTNILTDGNQYRNPYGASLTNVGTAYGIYMAASATSGNENKFYNNLVYNFNSSGPTYGIYISATNYAKVYHNTVSFDQTSATGTTTTAGIYATGTLGLDIRNNVVTITRGGTGVKQCLQFASASGVTSNKNDLYINSAAGTNYTGFYVSGFATLANWQTANAGAWDAGSFNQDPAYVNPSVNNYQPANPILNNVGANVGVANDILGNARTIATPDLGAYEFTVPNIDMGATTLVVPTTTTNGCYTSSESVTIRVKNYGALVIDFSINQVTVTCNMTGTGVGTLSGTINSGTLAVGATYDFVLPGTLDMSANGSYTFNASTSVTGDGNALDDAMSAASRTHLAFTGGTITSAPSSICVTGSTNATLGGSAGALLQWQSSTTSASGPWTNVGTGTTTYNTGSITQNTYLQVVQTCGANIQTTTPLTIVYNNPIVSGTTPGNICGFGSVALGATAVGSANLNWYANPTGGTSLGSGTTFNTPGIGANTTYYVSAAFGTAPTPNTFFTTNAAGNSAYGNLFDVQPINDIRLDSIAIYALTAGTNFGVYYRTGTGIGFNTSSTGWTLIGTGTITTLASPTTNLTVIPLNLNLLLSAGQTYSIAISTSNTVNYSNGTTLGSLWMQDANLKVYEGYGGSSIYPAFGFTNNPRDINGRFYYTTNLACESSPRTAVLATVNPSPQVTITPSGQVFCGTANAILTATDAASPAYTYTWSPSTGLSSTNTAITTATPTTTTTYVATGTNGTCSDTAQVRIYVNPLPVITSTNSSPFNCGTANSNLTAVSTNANYTIGAGVVQNTTSGYPTPFGQFYGSDHVQFLYLASDLTSAGVTAGGIFSLSYNIPVAYTGATMQGFRIAMAHTAQAALTTTLITTGFTTVYSPASYTPGASTGWTPITFTTPFNWNGTSNVVIDIWFSNCSVCNGTSSCTTSFTTNGIVMQSTTAYVSTLDIHADNNCTIASMTPSVTGTTYTQRPNIMFGQLGATISWSPATNLSCTTCFNPTATPTSSTTYTVTITNPSTTCSNTATYNVAVGSVPTTPTANGAARCGVGTVGLTASGSGGALNWYSSSNGGMSVGSGTSYNPYVSSTTNYYVQEAPTPTTTLVYGMQANDPGTTAYFSSTTNWVTFDVMYPGGIFVHSIDIFPNAATPIGSPITLQLENSSGIAVGAPFSTVTTVAGAVQTLVLDMFVPNGTGWRLHPTANPNIKYHQTGFTLPVSLNGVMQITGAGSPSGNVAVYPGAYNWVIYSGCFSAMATATATVNAAPPLTVTPSSGSYCTTGSLPLNASGTGYVNFSWSPTTGLSSSNISNPTASPTVTTIYTVTADDNNGPTSCVDSQTVVITVNTSPTVSISSNVVSPICPSSNFNLTAAGASSSYKQIGFTQNPLYVSVTPFNGGNTSIRGQMIVTAAELTAAGLIGPSNITSLGYYVSQKLSTGAYQGYTIGMTMIGATSTLTATYMTNTLTTVFTGNVTTHVGWNDMTFTTPFAWDGTSNILINTCFTNPGAIGFDQVFCTPTASAMYIDANLLACSATTGVASLNRPNVRFQGGTVTYSWSPSGGLSSSSVYNPTVTGPSSTGNYNYTCTVTDPATLCTGSAVYNFDVNGTPNAGVITVTSGLGTTFCSSSGGSISMALTGGTTASMQWQDSAVGGSWSNISGANSNTYTTPTVTTSHWYRLGLTCTGTSYSNAIALTIITPVVQSTLNDTICAPGIVTVSAIPAPGSTLYWYSTPSSQTPLGSGNSYTSPSNISSTTTYYVQATSGGTNTAGSLLTSYAGGNGSSANFFDVIPSTNLNITSLDVNCSSALGTAVTAQVWVRTGTCYLNVPTTAPGWTLFATINATSAGSGLATHLTFPGNSVISMLAGQTYALAVGFTTGSMAYSNATAGQTAANTTLASNAFITIKCGYGGTLTGAIIDRNWNGQLYFVANPACTSPRLPVLGVVLTPPSVIATVSTQNVCYNYLDTLHASYTQPSYPFSYSYTWMPGNLNGATVTVNPTVSTVYTVTALDANYGCTTTATTPATNILPLPTVGGNYSPAPPICTGTPITLTGTGALTYTWTGGAINGVAFVPSQNSFTVTGTAANGCQNSAVVNVPIINTPAPTATISGTTTICNGQSALVTVTLIGLSNNISFTILNSVTNQTTTYSNNGSSSVTYVLNVNPTQTTTYSLVSVIDNTSGCYGTVSGNCVITVNPVPVAGTATIGGANSTVLCASGGTAQITLSGYTGNITWQSATSPNGPWLPTSNTSNTANYTTPTVTSTTYFRAVLSNNPCYDVPGNTVAVYVNSPTLQVATTLITDVSAVVSWTPFSANASYDINYTGGSLTNVTSPLTLTGLNSGSLINLTVTQTNPACGVIGSTSFNTMCAAPSGLTLSLPTTYGFTANWNSVNGATGYQIYYRPMGGNVAWSSVTTNALTTTYVFGTPHLLSNTTYSVYVIALGCVGGSYPSATQTYSTGTTGCTAPTSITAVSTCPNQIQVSVTGGGSSVFYSFRKIYPVIGPWYGYTVASSSYTITLPGLPAGNEQYEVYAKNVCSTSPLVYSFATNVVPVTTPAKLPAPSNVLTSASTCNGFTVSWTPVVGATGYQVNFRKVGLLTWSGYAIPASQNVFTQNSFAGGSGQYEVTVNTKSCNNLLSSPSATVIGSTLTTGCRTIEGTQSPDEQTSNVFDESSLNVYPNPNEGLFNVTMAVSSNENYVDIQLINMIGQVVYTGAASVSNHYISTTLNLNDEAAGIYYLKVSENGNEYLRKVVITK